MKCYFHPFIDTVGKCSKCGKGVCRSCSYEAGGVLLCKDCVSINKGATVVGERNVTGKDAKRSIIISWVITAVLGIFLVPIVIIGLAEEGQTGLGIFISIFTVYAIWSTYWGWKVVWPWWRNSMGKTGCFIVANPIVWLFFTLLFFYIPFVCAYMYGVLGGGIYQYLKYRRLVREQV